MSSEIDCFHGKRASIEIREGRRWHRIVIADLVIIDTELFAIFREPYPKTEPEDAKVKIPKDKLHLFKVSSDPKFDFVLQSVLYRDDAQSDDTGYWERPPIVVTEAELNESAAEQDAAANP